MQILFILHVEAEEYKARKYNVKGMELIKWCKFNHVKLIKDLDCGFTESDYRDGIHINVHGQRKLANIMKMNLLSSPIFLFYKLLI